MEPEADAARCPLCGGPNGCALAAASDAGARPPCWCPERAFPRSLLERVPARARGRACICRACLEAELEAEPRGPG